jgi:hypothetical protein
MTNERKEFETRPEPAWRQTLGEYQRAFVSFQRDPGSLSRVAFLDRAMERLQAAYQEPGLFALGEVQLTSGAFGELTRGKHLAEEFLIRHKNGDWGDVSAEEAARNQDNVAKGWRIVSRYATRAGGEIRIATAPGLNETRLYGGDDDQPPR